MPRGYSVSLRRLFFPSNAAVESAGSGVGVGGGCQWSAQPRILRDLCILLSAVADEKK